MSFLLEVSKGRRFSYYAILKSILKILLWSISYSLLMEEIDLESVPITEKQLTL